MGEVRNPIKKSSIAKKEKIIKTCFELMCDKGYHNVTCIDIAKEAGVSTGIIYQYFNDKRDIFIEGVKDYANNIMFPMINILDNEVIDKNNIKDILTRMIDSFINDDKFNLNQNQLINYISILLIIRDIMHTSYIASLPIYNEYKYNQKEFCDKAKEMIENSIDNISTLGNINPIFIAIAAKSILPFSIKSDELSSSSKLISILFNISRIIGAYPYCENNSERTQPIFLSAIYNLTNNASFLGIDYKMIRQLYDKVKCGEIRWKN